MEDRVGIVFLGSYPWSVLLLEALWGAPGIDVAQVLTVPDRAGGPEAFRSPVAEFCRERGATDRLVAPATLDDPGLLRVLAGCGAHCALCAAYPRRVPDALCARFPGGGLNLHPSLLPRWRGPDPVRRALLAGDREAGVTLHQLVHAFDHGDVLWQEAVPVSPGETCLSLLEHLAQVAARALPGVLRAYARGGLRPRPQEGEATYAAAIAEEERWVRPDMTLSEANRLIAALYPFKPARWQEGEATHELLGPLGREAAPGSLRIVLSDGVFYASSDSTRNPGREHD